MVLERIKKFFSRKKVSEELNNIQTDISLTDESPVYVPEFDELSKSNKELVLSLANNINMNNHESVVKYSEDLAKRTDKYLSILTSVVKELDAAITTLKQIDKKGDPSGVDKIAVSQNLGDISLLSAELEFIKEELAKSDIIATIKTIAFKEFVKNECKRKPRKFTELFKAEKMEESAKLNGLLEEYKRLINTIRIIRSNIYAATLSSTIPDYSPEVNKMQDKYDSILNAQYLFQEGLHLCDINRKLGTELVSAPKIDDPNYTYVTTNPISCDYERIFSSLDYKGEIYNSKIRTLAKFRFDMDKVLYDHHLDYKYIVENMKSIIAMYKNKGSWRWDVDALEEQYFSYEKIVMDYLYVCKKFVNEGVERQLKNTLFDLGFYLFITEKYNSSGKSSRLFSEKEIKDRTSEKLKEIIGAIYKRDLESNYARITLKDMEASISLLADCNFLIPYLIDVYNKDINPIQTYIGGIKKLNHYPFEQPIAKPVDIEEQIYYNLKPFLEDKIKEVNSSAFQCQCEVDEISIERLYYILKLLRMDDKNINSYMFEKKKYSSGVGLLSTIKDLFVDSQLAETKRQYDERILFIPKQFRVYGLQNRFYQENPNINWDKLQAIYLEDMGSSFLYKYILQNKENQIKYRFVREKNRIHVDDCYFPQLKVIYIPDDAKLSDLSYYLDLELSSNKQVKSISKED